MLGRKAIILETMLVGGPKPAVHSPPFWKTPNDRSIPYQVGLRLRIAARRGLHQIIPAYFLRNWLDPLVDARCDRKYREVTNIITAFPPIVLTEQQMHIDAHFFVQSDPLPSGFQGNVRLRLELVDIGGPFITVASGLPGFNKARPLARMKEEFDRDVPLSIVGKGGSIMQIETKKFFSDDKKGFAHMYRAVRKLQPKKRAGADILLWSAW